MSDSPVLLLFVGVHKALETVNCSILLLKLDDEGTPLTPYNYELGQGKILVYYSAILYKLRQ